MFNKKEYNQNQTFPENIKEIPGIFFECTKQITKSNGSKISTSFPDGAKVKGPQVFKDLGIDYLGYINTYEIT